MRTLPSPEALRVYERVRPGLAARRLRVDQRRGHQVHRETMTCLKALHKAEQRGRWMTFCLLCALPVLSAIALAVRMS